MFYFLAKHCYEFISSSYVSEFLLIFGLSFVITLAIGYFVRKIMEHDKSDD